jgi:hypothetical protein
MALIPTGELGKTPFSRYAPSETAFDSIIA